MHDVAKVLPSLVQLLLVLRRGLAALLYRLLQVTLQPFDSPLDLDALKEADLRQQSLKSSITLSIQGTSDECLIVDVKNRIVAKFQIPNAVFVTRPDCKLFRRHTCQVKYTKR